MKNKSAIIVFNDSQEPNIISIQFCHVYLVNYIGQAIKIPNSNLISYDVKTNH